MKQDRLALAVFTVASAAFAQTLPAPPGFDVISVKPCTAGAAQSAGGGRSGSADSRTARLHLPCQTVKNLILQAYFAYADGRVHPPPFPELEGGPSWIDSARYIIDATSEAAATHAMMNGPMLQKLLQDRFQLKLRRDMRDGPAYALTVAKGGAKLTPYRDGDCVDFGLVKPLTGPPPPHTRGERPVVCGANRAKKTGDRNVILDVPGVSFDYFAKTFLAISFWDHPVIDKTGIDGLFNLRLEFTPDEATPGPPGESRTAPTNAASVPGPSIFIALQQQLGLKLEPAKAPREFLVIDSIQRPTEN